ncbi:hypothetical protein [Micromonospora sp. bgisy143]|uniref:hypothetical protein n=1 Tax=Micromonospora sp. bgisy143 TaxID=3413790 RepID=UPI003EB97D3A
MDEPRYGYGKGERPLWSSRDRDAEAVRRVLRRAGFRDVGERHLDGFAVEGASGDGPKPFYVSYCGYPKKPGTIGRCVQALRRAGFEVEPDMKLEDVLVVQRRPAGLVLNVPRSGRALLAAAIVCAVLATVALLASWIGTGQVRLAGGIGSAVLGALAAFLAGLWYQRELDERSREEQAI